MRNSVWLSGLGVAIAVMGAPVQAQSGAVGRITAYDKAINGIETTGSPLAARTAKFVPVVSAHYDMPAIAGLVVGPAWAKASAADKSSAIEALTRHSAISLARNFKGPSATAFTVDPKVIERAGSQIVKVTVGSDTLYYRMRGDKIIDVISGGVSQLALQRADIASTVASGGVGAMANKLRALDLDKDK
jgi:phospholipid transport system substrate-binding protein